MCASSAVSILDPPWQSIFLSGAWLDLKLLLVLTDCLFVCLFTISNRQPIVNQLRASGRNWFRTIITTKINKFINNFRSALSFLWCLLQHYAVL